MLRRHNNKKGQNTAEYAILIALVVAAIVAMQTYAQRALQARVQTSSTLLTKVGSTGANGIFAGTYQYEPYYQNTDYTTNRDDSESQLLIDNEVSSTFNQTANKTGASGTSYDNRVNTGEDFL